MWRDRTNLYISYRQSYSHPPTNGFSGSQYSNRGYDEEEQGRLLGNQDDGAGEGTEMSVLPPRYVDIKEEVAEYLVGINRKSAKLDKLHQKHVLPGFDDEDVRMEEEMEIENLTQDITKAFHDCQRSIKKIEDMVKSSSAGLSSAEKEVAKNIQRSLAAKVQEVSATFRKKQSAYLKKLGGYGGSSAERSSTPTYQSTQYASNPGLLESEHDERFSQNVIKDAQQQRVTSNTTVIAEREKEVISLAKSIGDVATIFRDLNQMVVDQGTILNRIDYTVELTADELQQANTELNDASKYQRRTTKRRIILLLLLLVAAMIIFLIIRPKKKDPSAPPPVPPSAPKDVNLGHELPAPPQVRDLTSSELYRRQWRRRRRRRSLDSTFYTT